MIPDLLASRYASSKILEIWSPEGKVRLEREFWIVVMKAQQKLGVDIPESAIKSYEKVKSQIDLKSISKRDSHYYFILLPTVISCKVQPQIAMRIDLKLYITDVH